MLKLFLYNRVLKEWINADKYIFKKRKQIKSQKVKDL